ncbi:MULTISPECIES: GNAT family N-acetyltransferase [Alphaproteobacteria]|uniref:N-acetyltransferase n=2 Tax=Alphaproteobacteria TaxID=28211 RepID=A0A512HIN7_9HYPH|nr:MULTISPECIES: GNAT family N-acetyltransferase [Alphaproteobacteria]GEO85306.1 N-acetyltransferase [Ciceribacter naphthalenivorans]GLR20945.1 N-acetyltransferase [Ciceribacter naphthalenivorans]GLT03801.1 N-acetyltransferase [Sphingomonas psychrolutea]
MADNATVTIREAGPEDTGTLHAALLALARHTGDEHKIESTPQDLLDHGFGAQPAFEALIAEVDGRFAGMCLSFPSFSTWRGQPGIYVQDLYVENVFRGRRIGERLLQAAAAKGYASGARYLRLSVDQANVSAQSFYERVGLSHSRAEQIHMMRGEQFEAFAQQWTPGQ